MSTKIRDRMMTSRRRQEEQTEMMITLNMTDRQTDRDRDRNREKDRERERGQIVETFIKETQRHAFGFKASVTMK